MNERQLQKEKKRKKTLAMNRRFCTLFDSINQDGISYPDVIDISSNATRLISCCHFEDIFPFLDSLVNRRYSKVNR